MNRTIERITREEINLNTIIDLKLEQDERIHHPDLLVPHTPDSIIPAGVKITFRQKEEKMKILWKIDGIRHTHFFKEFKEDKKRIFNKKLEKALP